MKKIYTTLLLLITMIAAHGQWSQMTNSELSTVEYNGIVYTGTSVIIITDGGIFRSADNGVNWSLSTTGLDASSISPRSIAHIGSRNEVWVSVGNTLYKSTDNGGTWNNQVLTGFPEFVWFDNLATIGNRLIVIYSYYDAGLGGHTMRLGYSDDGINWTAGSVLSIDGDSWWDFIPYHNSRALFMVEYDNLENKDYLWYTTDGNSKQLMPLTGLVSEPGINRRSFSIDQAGNTLLFVDENETKCYRYNFDTETWETIMNGITMANHSLAMLFKAHSLPNRLFVTALFADAEMNLVMTLFTSTDNGNNWTPVSTPGLLYPLFENQMIIAEGGRIISENFNSTLVYSDDNGQIWTRSTGIQAGSFPGFVGTSNGDLFTVTQEQTRGILRSSDNGATWSASNGNLINFQGIYIINGLQAGGNYLYVTAAENPFDEKLSLYLSTDFGGNWGKLTNAPDSAWIQFFGKSNIWPVVRFMNKNEEGTYQFTKDAGTTWIDMTPGIDAHNPDRVLGFTGNGNMGLMFMFAEKNNKTRVYLSENDGTTFTDITTNLDGPGYDIPIANRWGWDTAPSAIAGFRQDGQEFYLAAYDYIEGGGNVFFYRLNEDKNGWVKMGTSGLPLNWPTEFHSLLNRGGVWHFVTSAAVYASIDACASWHPIWNNEGFLAGTRPASFVQNAYGVFVGTYGAGIWKAQLTVPQFTTLAATEITDTSAVSGINLISTGGLPFGGKGLCWSLSPEPTINDHILNVGDKWENFIDTLISLSPNTDYYVRGFIWSPKGMGQPVYGNQITFRTDNITRVETEREGQIVIFPNPTNGQFNILVEKEWSMTIIDAAGRAVMSQRLNTGLNDITMTNPVPGVYYVRLTGQTKETQVVTILVK